MKKQENLTLFPWLLVFYEMAVYLSMDAYTPALPKIAMVFGVTTSVAQLTIIVWMAAGLLLQLIVGPLSEHYGRRPTLLYGGVLYGIATLICTFAPTIHILLLGRFLQGIAMPTMFIAGYATINDLFKTNQAIKILARMNGVTILAPAFGPLFGGAFLLFFDWRWIFAILAIWTFTVISLLFYNMPETIAQNSRQQPLKLNKVGAQYLEVLKNAKFMNASLVTFLPIVGLITWMVAGPFLIIHQFHYTTLMFGFIQTCIFASFIIGTKIVNKFATDERHNLLINLGLGLALLGSLLATIFSVLFPSALFIVIVFMMLVTFGCGLSMPILSRLTLDLSEAPMGIRVTIFSTIRIGSGVLGSVCVTLFYNGTLYSIAIIMLVFITIAAVLRMLNYIKRGVKSGQ